MARTKIRGNGHVVQVDSLGANVTRWQHNDQNIFFPFQALGLGDSLPKRRGGCHPCIPNFGIDGPRAAGYTRLPQHGPIRHMKWDYEAVYSCDQAALYAVDHSATRNFPFSFICRFGATITPSGFRHQMMILRTTASAYEEAEDSMPLNPAIHPYFEIPASGGMIRVGDKLTELGEPYPEPPIWPVPGDGKVKVTLAGVGWVEMTLDGYGYVVVWSDSRRYVCVEPVMHHPNTFGQPDGYFLYNGEDVVLTCDFSFTPAD